MLSSDRLRFKGQICLGVKRHKRVTALESRNNLTLADDLSLPFSTYSPVILRYYDPPVPSSTCAVLRWHNNTSCDQQSEHCPRPQPTPTHSIGDLAQASISQDNPALELFTKAKPQQQFALSQSQVSATISIVVPSISSQPNSCDSPTRMCNV